MNIGYSPIDIGQLLVEGHAAIDKEHAEKESLKAGQMRAGSAGCVVDGAVFGECHRVAYLRSQGVERTHTVSKKLMFQAGEGNEDLWEKVLVKGWGGGVLRGAQLGKADEYGLLTGSPDIVLTKDDGTWHTVLELKLISAKWTAINRSVHGQPDDKHLIQSLVYMYLSGLPVVLCYTNRTNFNLEFDRKKLGLDVIEPFYRMFYLRVGDGRLYWRDEFDAKENATPYTVAGIEEFYKLVHDMKKDGATLGDRPVSVGFNRCQPKYCPYADACDRWETKPREWLVEARAAV